MRLRPTDTRVFLTKTDTTVGFVSQDADKLTRIKRRPPHKEYIVALNALRTLQRYTRVPKKHKNRIRRAKKTTFIVPNGRSFRIVKDPFHLLLLNRIEWGFTTSANLSGKPYDENFAKKSADVVISPLMQNGTPSQILKLGKETIKRIR